MKDISLLHAALVTQVPEMDHGWKAHVFATQFPSGSKRGGLGCGGHAKITVAGLHGQTGQSQFCNINLFGKDGRKPKLALKQSGNWDEFTIIERASGDIAGTGKFFPAPAWYEESLPDGTPVTQIIQAHMGKEAVTVLGQTRCEGFDGGTACKYCSLQGGAENPTRLGRQVVEALELALQHGWKPASLAITTTWISHNNPLEHILDEIKAIKTRFPGLALAFEAQPLPKKNYALLRDAGINTIMIPMDTVAHAEEFTPIKKSSGFHYLESLEEAKGSFSRPGEVTSPIIVGLDPLHVTLGLVRALVEHGVKPEPIPLRVFDGRLAVRTRVADLYAVKNLTKHLWGKQFPGSHVPAGCSQCGGCSGV